MKEYSTLPSYISKEKKFAISAQTVPKKSSRRPLFFNCTTARTISRFRRDLPLVILSIEVFNGPLLDSLPSQIPNQTKEG